MLLSLLWIIKCSWERSSKLRMATPSKQSFSWMVLKVGSHFELMDSILHRLGKDKPNNLGKKSNRLLPKWLETKWWRYKQVDLISMGVYFQEFTHTHKEKSSAWTNFWCRMIWQNHTSVKLKWNLLTHNTRTSKKSIAM